MEQRTGLESTAAAEEQAAPCFPEWAAQQVDRLVRKRCGACTAEERALLDLQLAALCDVGDRYGRRLAEAAEL